MNLLMVSSFCHPVYLDSMMVLTFLMQSYSSSGLGVHTKITAQVLIVVFIAEDW